MTVNGIEINVTKKRIKNIYLRIRADGEVSVTAPIGCSDEKICSFVTEKMSWIIKNRKKVLDKNESDKSIPETVSIFGTEYPIRYVRANKDSVFINDEDVEVHVSGAADPEKVKKLVEKMYRKLTFEEISILIPKWSKRMGLYPDEWKICKMNSMWGNCRKEKKELHFSLNLASKPIEFIDYVVVHELAHLKEANHSEKFWRIVSQYIPDYREIRRRNRKK